MTTEVDEWVKVGVVFSAGTAKPAWFMWRNQKHMIKETTYTWQEKVGETTLSFFSCSDGANLYELVFDSKQLSWKLSKVYSDG